MVPFEKLPDAPTERSAPAERAVVTEKKVVALRLDVIIVAITGLTLFVSMLTLGSTLEVSPFPIFLGAVLLLIGIIWVISLVLRR